MIHGQSLTPQQHAQPLRAESRPVSSQLVQPLADGGIMGFTD